VDAVGIGATRREFLIPFLTICYLRASQSYRPDDGTTFHISNCRIPLDAGLPSKVE
jgi:hypothetical protein